MKNVIVLVMIGLVTLIAGSAFGAGTPVELSPANSIDLSSDDQTQAAGPLRDPAGDDWITYDDGNASLYFFWTNIYARVMFQPNVDFDLQAIRFLPLNTYNQRTAFNVYVYRQNQQTKALTDRVWAYHIDQLPAWDGQDFQNNWILVEIPEQQYPRFQANENFSIVIGTFRGGDANQQNTGPQPLGDGASQVNRSIITRAANQANGAVPTAWNQWVAVNSDIMLRANGTLLANFVDVGVKEVYNIPSEEGDTTGSYLVRTGVQKRFKAQLINPGSEVGQFILSWSVVDSANTAIFTYDQVVEGLGARDTAYIACDSLWSCDTPGRYRVWAAAQAGDDVNPENDIGGLDQIVWDPLAEEQPWLGYMDFEPDDNSGGPDGIMYAAAFYHPGGEAQYKLTNYRVLVQPAAQPSEVIFLVAFLDMNARQYTFTHIDTVVTDGTNNAQWLEVALQDSGQLRLPQPGTAALIFYTQPNGCRIVADGTPPSAGSNNLMPNVMWISFDQGQNLSFANSTDFAIEAKLVETNDPIAGPHLKVLPDTLNFGEGLERNREYTIEAQMIATGTDTINVTNIQLSNALARFMTVSGRNFTIASQDTETVTFTIRYAGNAADTTINNLVILSSNWAESARFQWRVHARFGGGEAAVEREVQPGIPNSFSVAQNYPNPFNPTTTINFAIPTASDVNLAIFDINGRQVGEPVQARLNAGYHAFKYDASSLPAGVYSYRVTAGTYSSIHKMVLIK